MLDKLKKKVKKIRPHDLN